MRCGRGRHRHEQAADGDAGSGRRGKPGREDPAHPAERAQHEKSGDQRHEAGAAERRHRPDEQQGCDGGPACVRWPARLQAEGHQEDRHEDGGGRVGIGQRGRRPPHPVVGQRPRSPVPHHTDPAGRRHEHARAQQTGEQKVPAGDALPAYDEEHGRERGEQRGHQHPRTGVVRRQPAQQRPARERRRGRCRTQAAVRATEAHRGQRQDQGRGDPEEQRDPTGAVEAALRQQPRSQASEQQDGRRGRRCVEVADSRPGRRAVRCRCCTGRAHGDPTRSAVSLSLGSSSRSPRRGRSPGDAVNHPRNVLDR